MKNTESYRLDANNMLDESKRSSLGQFMTSAPICRFMASLFKEWKDKEISLLDPGAGVGSLSVSFVDEFLRRKKTPKSIDVTCYEIDMILLKYLKYSMGNINKLCTESCIDFKAIIKSEDFIKGGVALVAENLLQKASERGRFSHAILNPPYKKISAKSDHRRHLRSVGIEVSNLYAGFLALSVEQLKQGGELVAIVPRSFCNGLYFKPFREFFLSRMSIEHLHIFDSREQAFKENKVLQENIILYAVKKKQTNKVIITSSPKNPISKNVESADVSFEKITHRIVPFCSVVKQNDPGLFIHIASTDQDQEIVDKVSIFNYSLPDLGLEVSTGPVVDFRLKDDLVNELEIGSVPLLYPVHFQKNHLQWPKISKKPNAIRVTATSKKWLWRNKGCFVIIRRFTSKEEKRRLVASVYDGSLPGEVIGFENHLNIIHAGRCGVDNDLAMGLTTYLNSTLLDKYFRQFSGHTQVNATDLRFLKYPNPETLRRIGREVGNKTIDQSKIDAIIEKIVVAVNDDGVANHC